jgi:hypothetical protein
VVEVDVFLLVAMVFGMANGAIESFLFWFLGDLGATTIVFGLGIVANCVFEVHNYAHSCVCVCGWVGEWVCACL